VLRPELAPPESLPHPPETSAVSETHDASRDPRHDHADSRPGRGFTDGHAEQQSSDEQHDPTQGGGGEKSPRGGREIAEGVDPPAD